MGTFQGSGYQFCKKWMWEFFGEVVTYFVKMVEKGANLVKKNGYKMVPISPTFRKKLL